MVSQHQMTRNAEAGRRRMKEMDSPDSWCCDRTHPRRQSAGFDVPIALTVSWRHPANLSHSDAHTTLASASLGNVSVRLLGARSGRALRLLAALPRGSSTNAALAQTRSCVICLSAHEIFMLDGSVPKIVLSPGALIVGQGLG